jgi:NDP-sugar pyrophosphorylase family protein
MEKFLGILFCGGRGKRLGEITKYISKSFIPIYDRPVFQFGLTILKQSKYIDEIILLTNSENYNKLNLLGYQTIIQDDDKVYDMFSGWKYIKKVICTKKDVVLMPSDNISNIDMDALITLHIKAASQIAFSLFRMTARAKMSEMGTYDPAAKRFYYKHPDPPTDFGVIAPYVVKNQLEFQSGDEILGNADSIQLEHKGYWYDIGDYHSIVEATNFIKNQKGDKNAGE